MPNSKQQEFTSIIQANRGLIYKVTNTYCNDQDSVNDLFQEIVEQLWKSFHKYDPQYKLSTWIYRIALNVAISSYRKESVRKKKRGSFDEAFLVHTPEESQDEEMNLLYQFIEELGSLDKALILLYLEDRKAKEISEILGITESNVTTKVGRIKKKLKERFETVNR